MRTLSILLLAIFSYAATAQTHIVNTTASSGTGSLRAAVEAANDGDTVLIDPVLLNNGSTTITVTTPIYIDSTITIIGAIQGGDTVAISGGNSSKVFHIDMYGGKDAYFHDLLIIEGAGTIGAGIYAENVSDLNLYNCVLRNNTVSGNYRTGGAIFIDGTLRASNTKFINNSAGSCSGSTNSGGGGAITANSGLFLDSCLFSGNSTCGTGGAIYAGTSGGSITNSTFINNQCGPSSLPIGGGALLWNGGGDKFITNCSFINNTSSSQGGAIQFTSNYSRTIIEECYFEGNEATTNSGGAINSFATDTLIVRRSTFYDNNELSTSQYVGGGAIYSKETTLRLEYSTFYNNSAPVIEYSAVNSWASSIQYCTLVNNTAPATDFIAGDPQYTLSLRSNLFSYPGSAATVENNFVTTSNGFNIFPGNPTYSVGSDYTNTTYASHGFNGLSLEGGKTPVLLPSKMSSAYNNGPTSQTQNAQNSPVFWIREIGAAEIRNLSIDTVSSCGPYVFWNDTITESGTYTKSQVNFTYSTIDSAAVLYLTVTDIDTMITMVTNGLLSHEQSPGATYQWYTCDTGLVAIPGATDSILSLPFDQGLSGSWAVVVSLNGCTDTICRFFSTISIDETSNQRLKVSPIPARDYINLQTVDSPSEIVLIDLNGSIIRRISGNTDRVYIGDLPAGTYLLSVRFEKESPIIQRVIKL